MKSRAVVLLFCVGCSVEQPDAVQSDATTATLSGGTPAADPAVVIVSGVDGTFCSGALIGARAVLTAKHCVQAAGEEAPSDPRLFSVSVGADASAITFATPVIDIFAPSGVFTVGGSTGVGEGIEGDDIAVLMLRDPIAERPLAVRAAGPAGVSQGRAIGFGTTETGSSGEKRALMISIVELRDRTLVGGPGTCAGDSGGPLTDPTGEVIGVSSFNRGGCGLGTSHFTRTDVHGDLIATALAAAGSCTPSGAETCDGRDNDCNGVVDDPCVPLGGPCTSASECRGGALCAETATGTICTERCDPRRPSLGCGPGLYCRRSDLCDGLCVPGTPGVGLDGQTCTADSDCRSLLCVDPGDGRSRCASPCESDTGMCAGDRLCAANVLSCGGCVDEGWSGSRGIGEPCAEDGDCLSAHCGTDGGATYCSRFCAEDDECGAAFHCRAGECVRGPRGASGEECLVNDDCRDGLECTEVGESQVCTADCALGCASGFVCVADRCVPNQGVLGESCGRAGDCVSGLCAATSEGSQCTRECSAVSACPPTFRCVAPDDESSSVCVRQPPPVPEPEPVEQGCAAVAGGNLQSGWLCAFVCLLGWIRRRSR
ncbi:MAG: S1 family peptidase [Myxococcota bacterium]